MSNLGRFALVLAAVLGLGRCLPADDLLDSPKSKAKQAPDAGDVEDLLEGADGRVRFRLVPAGDPDSGLDDQIYWRSVAGVVAAEVAPIEFRLGDAEVLAPETSRPTKGHTAEPIYPTESRIKLQSGKHLLVPGGIPINVEAGEATASHPAVLMATGKTGPELRIRCAPVRLDAVDRRGRPVPIAVRVTRDEKSLLRKEARFNPLILWLPVGGQYDSSFGRFTLTAEGKVDAKASRLAAGVEVTAAGLRQVVDDEAAAAVADASNVARMTTRGGRASEKPALLTVYVPPVVGLGQPAGIGFSKREYRAATGEEFSPDQFTAHWFAGSDGTDDPLELHAGGTQPPKFQAEAATALGCSQDDVATLLTDVPDFVAGPAVLAISGKRFEPFTAKFLVADVGRHVQLLPHRWRTSFAQTEEATYTVLLSGPWKSGPAELVCQRQGGDETPAPPVKLGAIDLPEVGPKQSDSRLFVLHAGDLPAGKYQLWLAAAGEESGRVPLEVMAWFPKSPFLLQAMSCCMPCWPLSESGLSLLESFDFQMGTSTGHASLLNTAVPQLDPQLAARLHGHDPRLPADLTLAPTGNDRLLARLLRHHIRLIDLTTARGANFYNEGLSYHHSYPPSVARMIRRLQLFTQQTGDYPSFWGVNYSWFPALGGYVEGGVPTDPHTADRMRSLDESLRTAGLEPATAADLKWLGEHKASEDPAEQQRVGAIARRATDWWKAEQESGFGAHNRLYNAAVHEVRPQTVCTLFENAGHDEGKRSHALFADMAAACYESYTDYGDWPMSSAFAADWARGNTGGQPVWLTVCQGTTPEGTMKSLFHALARGIRGGGSPLSYQMDPAEVERRGKGLRFVSQYGAIPSSATPDSRVALLSRACRQAVVPRGMYELHAAYYHLSRLSYPPIIVSDDELNERGVPAQVEVLVLVQEQIPLEPELERAIAAFQRRGGQVLSLGTASVHVADEVALDTPIKNLWELGGFEAGAHAQMWQEFNQFWRRPLAAALEQLKVEPLAATDPARAIALTADVGGVRYLTVIADAEGTHSNDFQPVAGLPLSLAGAGWIVRDLVSQQTLATRTEGERTLLTLDLATEPTALLALYKQAPARVDIRQLAPARSGGTLEIAGHVVDANKKRMAHLPVAYTLAGPDGRVRRSWFEGAGTPQHVPLAAHDQAGNWTLQVQELVSGITAKAKIAVEPPAAVRATVVAAGDVHVVDPGHVRRFAQRKSEKLVIVEPGQEPLVETATRLAAALNAAGVSARLWQVAPEEFDTIPLRWYPQPFDSARLEQIAAGKLIGYRGNLVAHIDKIKRTHVPELGGYGEVDPPYIVGEDCIIFSGGRLAESLRAVSPWLNTPTVPGRGQGRLLVALSPFMADRQALAVIANDEAGTALAVDRFIDLLKPAAEVAQPTPSAAKGTTLAAASAVLPVPQPYRGFSPPQRALRLLANRDGNSAVLLRGEHDNLALVDAAGKVTATIATADLLPGRLQLDDQGRLHGLAQKVLAVDPGWHLPAEIEVRSQAISPDGRLTAEQIVYAGELAGLPPDWEAGFAVAPNGNAELISRAAALFDEAQADRAQPVYRDVDRVRWRFSILYPRRAVGSTFSPDGRFVLFTMDSRPPFGGMGSPATQPTASETVLWDVERNEAVWRLADTGNFANAPYAVHTGFAAVARDGRLTAIAGFDGSIYLVDVAGKVVMEQEVSPAVIGGRIGPIDGVGVGMSDAGELTAFAFKNLLVLAAGDQVQRVELPRVAAVTVLADGSAAVVALVTGELRAFDARGQVLWSAKGDGPGTIIAAAGASGVLVANGAGELALLDGAGRNVWRTDLAVAVDRADHPLEPVAGFAPLAVPADYFEPETLNLAKKNMAAQETARWQPGGSPTETAGRKFYPLAGKIELTGRGEGDSLMHLVYRRPAENKSLRVVATDSSGTREFLLDLPTPTYRVVDLPLAGKEARVAVVADGPAEVAECSLWSFKWPGVNLCYVKPAGSKADDAPRESNAGDLEDLLDEAGAKTAGGGRAKSCKIYCPNSDVDRVAGNYLPVPLDPTQIVDGRRFEAGKLPPWAPLNRIYFPTRGAFFTIDLGRPVPIGLVATYDRSLRQSEVARRIAIFTTEALDDIASGKVLAGEADNDQFWRLFPLDQAALAGFGVHIFSGPSQPAGLSEVEAYR